MAKTSIKIEPFLNGLCDFWQLDENRKPVLLQGGIRFQRRVVGSKRNFCAEQAGHKVEMLIRIPRTDLIVRGTFAVIDGSQYAVVQAQMIPDTVPQCTDITLEQPDILLSFDKSEPGHYGRL